VLFVEQTGKMDEIDKDNVRWTAAKSFVQNAGSFYLDFLNYVAPDQYTLSIAVVPFDGSDNQPQAIQFAPRGKAKSPWIEMSDYGQNPRDFVNDFDNSNPEAWTNVNKYGTYGNYAATLDSLEDLLNEGGVRSGQDNTQVVVVYIGTGVSCPQSATCYGGVAGAQAFGEKLKEPQWKDTYNLELGDTLEIHMLPLAGGLFSKQTWTNLLKDPAREVRFWPKVDQNDSDNQGIVQLDEISPTLDGIFNQIWLESRIVPQSVPFRAYTVTQDGAFTLEGIKGKFTNPDRITKNGYEIPYGVSELRIAGYNLVKQSYSTVGRVASEFQQTLQVYTQVNPKPLTVLTPGKSGETNKNLTGVDIAFVYEKPLNCDMVSKVGSTNIDNQAYQYELLTIESDCGDYPYLEDIEFKVTGNNVVNNKMTTGAMEYTDGKLQWQVLLEDDGLYNFKFDPSDAKRSVFTAGEISVTVTPSQISSPLEPNCSLPQERWPGEEIGFDVRMRTNPNGQRYPQLNMQVFFNDSEEFEASSPVEENGQFETVFKPKSGSVPIYVGNKNINEAYVFTYKVNGEVIEEVKCEINVINLELDATQDGKPIAVGSIQYDLSEQTSKAVLIELIETFAKRG